MTRPTSAPRLLAAAVALLLIVGVAAAVVRSRSTPFGIDHAIGVLQDDARFSTPPEAGDTFARLSKDLLDEARRCRGEQETGGCDRFLSASAYAQAFAVPALTCSLPVITAARRDLLDHLQQLAAGAEASLPEIPTC